MNPRYLCVCSDLSLFVLFGLLFACCMWVSPCEAFGPSGWLTLLWLAAKQTWTWHPGRQNTLFTICLYTDIFHRHETSWTLLTAGHHWCCLKRKNMLLHLILRYSGHAYDANCAIWLLIQVRWECAALQKGKNVLKWALKNVSTVAAHTAPGRRTDPQRRWGHFNWSFRQII